MTKAPAPRTIPAPRGSDAGIRLGFQWDAASWGAVPLLWDALVAWVADRPVFWNLPAFPQDMPARRRTSVSRSLAARISHRHEPVTAAGFSGACHPLLTIDELDREVGWGLRNPWSTGIGEVLGLRPTILLPRVPDLTRIDAWKVYRDHGFTRVGACVRDPGSVPGAPGSLLSIIRIPVSRWFADAGRSRVLRRAVFSRSGLTVVVDLAGCTDPAVLTAVLEGASGVFGGRSPPLAVLPEPQGELPARPAPSSAAALDWSPFTVAELHAVLDETAAAARKKKKKSEEVGLLLTTLGAVHERTAAPPAPRRVYQPQLLAHMLGDVTLGGSEFDVLLHGGRFSGIAWQGRELTPRRPAGAWLRLGRRISSLRTVSSVSFESDAGTGLQEELGLDGKDGTLVRVEYSFRDDSPDLTIDLDLQMPPLPAGSDVEEYAPLALALRSLRKGEAAVIEVAAPDGSASSVEVSERGGSVLVAGAEHRVRRADGGWIVLRFATPTGRAWGLPWFRVARCRRERFLEVNPFGSFVPVPARSLARKASFRMTIGIA